MKNLITDVEGVTVGHADDTKLASGVTAIVFDAPSVAAMDVRGGGPGIRESVLLELSNTIESIDALGLSGGSAHGLEAGGGIQAWLTEQGRGFAVGDVRIPLVPGAILFDMTNGGDKHWGRFPPYRDLGYAAASAATTDFKLGSVGAGLGATTATLKGGLGSASDRTQDGVTVGALVAVNAIGSTIVGDGPWFWAGPFEQNGEFGGRGLPQTFTPEMLALRTKGGRRAEPMQNTTLAVIATDAVLTRAQAKRLAMIAQTGFARAIYPVHAPLDGDVVFAVATGRKPLDGPLALTDLGALAANTMARAIARGVFEATALPYPGSLPSWKDRFGK
jgi:L-aminopeptidase/D-esterase-like protein